MMTVEAGIKGIQYKSTFDYLQTVSFGFIQLILYELKDSLGFLKAFFIVSLKETSLAHGYIY